MTDHWKDVREQIGDVSGGGECKEPDLCRGCVYDLLTDADALLVVVRACNELAEVLNLPWQSDNVTEPERAILEARAALPEHLK